MKADGDEHWCSDIHSPPEEVFKISDVVILDCSIDNTEAKINQSIWELNLF